MTPDEERKRREIEERRHEPVVAVKIWQRQYPVTPKNILTAIAFISVVGGGMFWLLSHFGPLATTDDLENLASKSDRNYNELVKNDSVNELRLSYLERVAEVAAYRDCIELRADTITPRGRDEYPPNCDDIILNVLNGSRRQRR